MTTYYKLTDNQDRTHGRTQWGPGVRHESPGDGALCTNGWIHVYDSPELASLLNTIGANFNRPHLWVGEGEEPTLDDHGLKRGVRAFTTVKRVPLPRFNTVQRIAFGILCARSVYRGQPWLDWADRYLDGLDRTGVSARAATVAAPEVSARAAARAAVWAAVRGAVWAAAREAATAAEWAAQSGYSIPLAALARQAKAVK